MTDIRRPGSHLCKLLRVVFLFGAGPRIKLEEETRYMTEIQQSEPSLLMELGVDGCFAQKFFDEKRYDHL